MAHFYDQVKAALTAGRPVVTAVIVSRRGSAPRTLGTKLVLEENGDFVGSVGGGLLEAEVLAQGRALFKSHRAKILHFDLMGQGAEAAGMICGGVTDLYLEYFDPADETLVALMGRLAELAGLAEPAVLALALDEDAPRGRRFLVAQGEALAPPKEPWPEAIESLRADLASHPPSRPKAMEGYFIEPVQAAPTVYIFGAGHISLQIVPLAALVDFRVVVIDDREEFASSENFPMAEETLCCSFEEVFSRLEVSRSGYVVIVTRGHRWDGVVLAQALATPAAYVGMIGSRNKIKAVFEALGKQGFGPDDLERVHAPIGLDIGAETPEEIAVAIVAELIQVRAAQSDRPTEIKTWQA